MFGAAICNMEGAYRGLGRNNSIPDYLEDGKLGESLQAFLEDCTNFETQMIEYNPAAIGQALGIAKSLSENGAACEVILFCDSSETIDEPGITLLGLDIVGSSLFESPLAHGLLDANVNEDTVDTYRPFFARKHRELVTDGTADLNQHRLLTTLPVAKAIASLLNELTAGKYKYLFDEETGFTVVKIYAYE